MSYKTGFTPLEIKDIAYVYTYVIRSIKNGMWYTGYTHDLRKRLDEHNNNKVFSTKNRGPFELIYFEGCINERDARNREKYLKSGMGKRYLKNRLKCFLSLTGFTLLEINKSLDTVNGNASKKIFKKSRFLSLTGFTLIELMTVVIIIGILAGIALPLYSKVVERSRISEAVNMLGAIRDAELRFALDYDSYNSNIDTLDIGNVSLSAKFFSFTVLSAVPNDSIDQAIASAVRNSLHSGTYSQSYNITINENGALSSNDTNVAKLF